MFQDYLRGTLLSSLRTPEVPDDLQGKINQIKYNLRSKTRFEWGLFFVIVPAVLYFIYLLPQGIKDTSFILNTDNAMNIPTYLLSGYTHTQLFPHMVGNLIVYAITMLVIFALENNMRRFWVIITSSFLIVPFISSTLTIQLWKILGASGITQGFSAIVAALIAYSLISIVLWILGDMLTDFDHPEHSESKNLFYLASGMLTLVLMLVVVGGLNLGMFVETDGAITNGIAHFGGFMTGLVVFLLFDMVTERRRYFHIIVGASLGAGCLMYVSYLITLAHVLGG
jgi:hypothetical protein